MVVRVVGRVIAAAFIVITFTDCNCACVHSNTVSFDSIRRMSAVIFITI